MSLQQELRDAACKARDPVTRSLLMKLATRIENRERDASVDTHAERCDVKQAQPARVGSAVPEGQTPKGNRR